MKIIPEKVHELSEETRFFNVSLIRPDELIVRSMNQIQCFKNNELFRSLRLDDYPVLNRTYTGLDYASFVVSNDLMLVDKHNLHVWNINSSSFKSIKIKNEPIKSDEFESKVFEPVHANSRQYPLVPVLFKTQVNNESPFFSLLDISDLNNVHWTDEKLYNLPIKEYPRNFYQIQNPHLFNLLDIIDIKFIDNNLIIYSTGYNHAYGFYGMDFSICSKYDSKCNLVEHLFHIDNCFGKISSDNKWVILTPIRKNGISNGKPFLFDLEKIEVELIDFPKGYLGCMVHDVHGDTMVVSNLSYSANFHMNLYKKKVARLTVMKINK